MSHCTQANYIQLVRYSLTRWKVRTRRSKLCPKVEEGFAPSAYLKAKNETVDLELGDVAEEPKKDELTTQKDLKKKKEYVVQV